MIALLPFSASSRGRVAWYVHDHGSIFAVCIEVRVVLVSLAADEPRRGDHVWFQISLIGSGNRSRHLQLPDAEVEVASRRTCWVELCSDSFQAPEGKIARGEHGEGVGPHVQRHRGGDCDTSINANDELSSVC